jgi:hypothetical protein
MKAYDRHILRAAASRLNDLARPASNGAQAAKDGLLQERLRERARIWARLGEYLLETADIEPHGRHEGTILGAGERFLLQVESIVSDGDKAAVRNVQEAEQSFRSLLADYLNDHDVSESTRSTLRGILEDMI